MQFFNWSINIKEVEVSFQYKNTFSLHSALSAHRHQLVNMFTAHIALLVHSWCCTESFPVGRICCKTSNDQLRECFLLCLSNTASNETGICFINIVCFLSHICSEKFSRSKLSGEAALLIRVKYVQLVYGQLQAQPTAKCLQYIKYIFLHM